MKAAVEMNRKVNGNGKAQQPAMPVRVLGVLTNRLGIERVGVLMGEAIEVGGKDLDALVEDTISRLSMDDLLKIAGERE